MSQQSRCPVGRAVEEILAPAGVGPHVVAMLWRASVPRRESQCPEVAVSRRWRMWHPGGSVPWDVPSGGASVPRGEGHPVELWPRGVVGPGMDGQGGVAPRVVCVRSKSVPGRSVPRRGVRHLRASSTKGRRRGAERWGARAREVVAPKGCAPRRGPTTRGSMPVVSRIEGHWHPPGSVHDQGWVGAQGASAHGVEIRALGQGFRRPDEHHSIQKGKDCWTF